MRRPRQQGKDGRVGDIQCRKSVHVLGRVNSSACRDEEPQDASVALLRCQKHRRGALLRQRVDVRPFTQEQLHNGIVALVCSVVQRGVAAWGMVTGAGVAVCLR